MPKQPHKITPQTWQRKEISVPPEARLPFFTIYHGICSQSPKTISAGSSKPRFITGLASWHRTTGPTRKKKRTQVITGAHRWFPRGPGRLGLLVDQPNNHWDRCRRCLGRNERSGLPACLKRTKTSPKTFLGFSLEALGIRFQALILQ